MSILSNIERDIGGYPVPQYFKKNWQMPKYRVDNQQNTDTSYMIGTTCLKLYPSRVFFYLKHLCTSNQPQPLQENVRRPRIDWYNNKLTIEKDALPIKQVWTLNP